MGSLFAIMYVGLRLGAPISQNRAQYAEMQGDRKDVNECRIQMGTLQKWDAAKDGNCEMG
jgi:hypothetical protein